MKRVYRQHWDAFISLVIAIDLFIFLPKSIPNTFAKDVYLGGVAVLAVLFSVVFAAVSLLSSVGDESFIAFLETEDDALTKILNSFTFSLNVLFSSLVLSISAFGYSAYRAVEGHVSQCGLLMTVFSFSILYSLLVSRLIANDVIRFAKLRARFIVSKSKLG